MMRLPETVDSRFAALCQRDLELEPDGMRVAFLETGSGPPVLLLHGAVFSGNSFMWELQAALSPSAHVYAPDFPGWGDSSKPLCAYTLDFYHRFIDRFLDALGLERVTIVAHSMGGLIGASYALTHPKRVRALATIAVPPPWVDIGVPNLFKPLMTPLLGEFSLFATPLLGLEAPFGISYHYETLFHDRTRIPSERLRQVLTRCCATLGDAHHRQAVLSTLRSNQTQFGPGKSAPYRKLLEDVTFPVLLVAARQDPLFPLERFYEAVERFPAAQLEVLEPCGHFPMWEQPERLVSLLHRFIAQPAGVS